MKRKVIMLLSNEFAPDPRVYNEAQALVENGFDIRIIAWDRKKAGSKFENYDGMNVERLQITSTYGGGIKQLPQMFHFWLAAFQRILASNFNLVHCHDFDTLMPGFFAGKLRGKKVIFDAHESYADMLLVSSTSQIASRLIRLTERFLIRHVDALITVGETLRQEYVKLGAKKNYLVGNWKRPTDFEFPIDKIQSERERLGIAHRFAVSYIGRLNNDRPVLQLIEAVKQNSDSVFLILAGAGTLEDRIVRTIRGCENIRFLGFLSPKDVSLYTAISDVVYYGMYLDNANAKFSAPNKLFEALAAGKAVITTNIGEVGKIVKEEGCGIVLDQPTVEAICEALHCMCRYQTLERFQQNAMAAGKTKYNWESAKQELLEAYGFQVARTI